ncbi:hypothetical protein [Curtobacterium oceanosedimentum]|uniref:Uncharacterized protein n=1 Tax=Curtobacterium oceanosedimentum TaxID=465820 RepID=A0A147DTT3_9MICO|nr:hypothetical protein [Curtobacterium oceanosedimentum]KTR53777.1 hypothetical protein NS359_01870 [Curtobacterium oceanosedimentum]
MTTATPTVTSSITTDASWLLVPHPDEVDTAWRAETLELFDAVVRLDDERPEHRTDERLDTVAALDTLLAFRAGLGPGQWLVASLAVPGNWPLPVVVTVGLAEGGTTELLELAGATGGLPIEPPSVDELPDHVGGEGPVVTRYDLDDDGAIWASVTAVRRADGVDTHVLWRTTDLGLVPVFAPLVVDLLATVENEVHA